MGEQRESESEDITTLTKEQIETLRLKLEVAVRDLNNTSLPRPRFNPGVYEKDGQAYEMTLGPGPDICLGPSWMHEFIY
ncbi:MAG: hypothetical protein NUV97_01560 [archaeon]|nr:hypothetical protein [archaeon]MCR4323641.1 hypothetical protein [Nanoarchaeota archaeon]